MQLQLIDIALVIALIAVSVTLGFGIYSMMKGGQYARTNSNRLMRLRVVLQAVAIVVLVVAFYVKRVANGG